MKEIHIENLVRPKVRGLSPYQVEKVPYKVKLVANESPYSLPLSFLMHYQVSLAKG